MQPVNMETANGMTHADQVVPLVIGELEEIIEPYLLESTPDVLSVGARCEMKGYRFVWEPFSKHPYFVTPEGERVVLTSIEYVPYLLDEFNTSGKALLAPAVPGKGTPGGVAEG